MLKMDLGKLSKREIADAVSLHCADVGLVQSVIIMCSPAEQGSQAYALICMNSEEAVKSVVRLYGDGEVDGMALIRLEQEDKVIPKFLLQQRADREPDFIAENFYPNAVLG